jgi:hypothetical protein
MSYEHINEDGTVEITRRMSDYVKGLPTIRQWQLWLALTRPDHALTVGSLVLYTCIGCGNQFTEHPNAWRSEMRDNDTYKIRIGATIRMSNTETRFEGGTKIIEHAYLPRPVTKRGLGCTACMQLFSEEERKVAGANATSERINNINATLALLKGCVKCGKQPERCSCEKFKPFTFKGIGLKEAFIPKFEGVMECGDCKDTYHRWDPEAEYMEDKVLRKGKYVVCSCYKPTLFGRHK